MGSTGWTACGWCGIEGENFHIPDSTLSPLCVDCDDILWDTGAPPGGGRVAACMAWWRAVGILEKLDDTMLNRIAKFQHGWDAPWPDHRGRGLKARQRPQERPTSAVAAADIRSSGNQGREAKRLRGGDRNSDCEQDNSNR